MAPYRGENKEPLSMTQMTFGKNGAVEQGSGNETVVDGYPVMEGYPALDGYSDENNERYV